MKHHVCVYWLKLAALLAEGPEIYQASERAMWALQIFSYGT